MQAITLKDAKRNLSELVEQVLADGSLASVLLPHIHDFGAAALNNFIEIIRRPVKFLSAHDQIHVRQPID